MFIKPFGLNNIYKIDHKMLIMHSYIVQNPDFHLMELNKFRITFLELYQKRLDQIKQRFTIDQLDLKYGTDNFSKHISTKKIVGFSIKFSRHNCRNN